MINKVGFNGRINPYFDNRYNPSNYIPSYAADSFVRTTNSVDSAKATAEKKIIEAIKDKGIEYGVVISQNGLIIDEIEGTEERCPFNPTTLEQNCILMHGHPEVAPLSPGDIKILLCSDAKSMEAITEDGKFSRLTKNTAGKSYLPPLLMHQNLEKQLYIKAMDTLGIDYTETKQDYIDMFKEFYAETSYTPIETITDESAIATAKAYDIDFKNDDLNTIKKKFKEVTQYARTSRTMNFNKVDNTIVKRQQEIDAFLSTEDGMRLKHEYLQDIATQYNLTYETNFFE